MPLLWIVLVVLGLGLIGYLMGRSRALGSAGGDGRQLHSLPSYYGWHGFMLTVVPALLMMAAWLLVAPSVIENRAAAGIPDAKIAERGSRSLVMAEVRRTGEALDMAVAQGTMDEDMARNLRADFTDVTERLKATGAIITTTVDQPILEAAQNYRVMAKASNLYMSIAVLGLAVVGLVFAFMRSDKDFRARNVVEQGIKAILILASTIAIMTTLGIVLSMLFETANFFEQYSWREFFFGLNWAPDFRGNSELGMLPLLWGTLYISLVALLVAVPIGLFAAIYLSEYASPRLRAVAKPMIEILAGIPTIVYGLFALITVGPLIRDWIAQPAGFGNSTNSVITAGLVMGIMLIPFVSSLSDDIINAVPQAMRDGSYGLGATQSETIKQVVLPAALPGIVGAVLLAASRAIGETMIVVMGAGAAAAQMEQGLGAIINPFQAMTTVTVKIVSQLTGDTDFASPETLVAFALGLTLFVITLGLNVLALYIVRKYREQYE
ncbi:phosphate ABC transporter permease subunit PstC [Tropicimonas sediminicola]|uniref:Phosphate transport system permease protein n=1 Tax=Tropicimonas sediminicola TaxID=1031541 RepID=A0A239JSX9_9RHOB|nr:phosphate ABC transporter permease subunit PstC [Tropicimonas sediminicola]SNT08930.1 phosphate ABC transporter membrane protein 1, PhoT family [Tropicimonas sediminicola]